MSAVVQMHRTKSARITGAGVAAYLAARSMGLSPIMAEAIKRHARESVARGMSAAMAVSEARAKARAMCAKVGA